MFHGRPASLCVVGVHPAWFSSPGSVLTSPKQMAALPSHLSVPMAEIRLNGPPNSRNETEAGLVLQAFVKRRARVYVQERREVVHVQKGLGPCVPFQGLRNSQGTEKRAIAKTTMPHCPQIS